MEAFPRIFFITVFRLLVLISIVLLTACQSTRSLDRSTMAMGFTEATFGLGIGKAGKRSVLHTRKLRRWEKDVPILLVINGEPQGSELYRYIKDSLKNLYQYASLDLTQNKTLSKQLLRLEIRDESLLVNDQIKAPCYTDYRYERNGYLRTVDIVISRSAIENMDANCLIHEGMHSLGFGGHPHRLQSVLSYTENFYNITNLDKRLIDLLYNENFVKEMSPNNALTTAYSMLGAYTEPRGKRYVPQDLSLELTRVESPLILRSPFLENASKRFFYITIKNGRTDIEISYGTRSSGKKFAFLQHTILSSDKIFRKLLELSEFVENSEPYYGKTSETKEGYIENELGGFKYLLTSSSSFSCVFTIKYIGTIFVETGGHQVIFGNYCSDISSPLREEDARDFITSIQLVEQDPVKMRERKTNSKKNNQTNISAIRVTGKWPVNSSYVSGMKIIEGGKTAGQIKITINNEPCEGMLSNIGTNGLGDWVLDCEENENSKGRFSWDEDGSFSFKGQTTETLQDIDWIAYQVF